MHKVIAVFLGLVAGTALPVLAEPYVLSDLEGGTAAPAARQRFEHGGRTVDVDRASGKVRIGGRTMARFLWVLVVLGMILASSEVVAEQSLRFRKNGTFKIVQFTDLHWGNGSAQDQQTLALMAAVLDVEQPDLVVFTGDNIGGGKCLSAANAIRAFTRPCIERRTPWAAVFGNHDDECHASREEQMRIMRELDYCLAEPGPKAVSGVGNYILPIRASHGRKTAARLYLLDSHGDSQVPGIEGYAWVKPDQIEWYRTQALKHRHTEDAEPLPALAFFHIPLPEFDTVWDRGNCIGEKNESVCCPQINSGLFAALLEVGDVLGVFVGHDHVNDYMGNLAGIWLAYGRGTGFDTYGKEGFPRGARVILLEEGKRDFKTWLRLDGNDVVEQGM